MCIGEADVLVNAVQHHTMAAKVWPTRVKSGKSRTRARRQNMADTPVVLTTDATCGPDKFAGGEQIFIRATPTATQDHSQQESDTSCRECDRLVAGHRWHARPATWSILGTILRFAVRTQDQFVPCAAAIATRFDVVLNKVDTAICKGDEDSTYVLTACACLTK